MADEDPDVISFDKARQDKWQNDAIKGTSGMPLPIVANVLMALRRDKNLRDVFAYDEMARQIVLTQAIGNSMAPFELRAIVDQDVIYVAEYLQQAGLKHVGTGVVREAISVCALENSWHPVRDYLDRL